MHSERAACLPRRFIGLATRSQSYKNVVFQNKQNSPSFSDSDSEDFEVRAEGRNHSSAVSRLGQMFRRRSPPRNNLES